MLPEMADTWLSNPSTADAFKLGSRNAVRLQLGRNADELKNLIRTAGTEGSLQNQVLRQIYGDDAIERLANFADLEAKMRRTEGALPSSIEQSLAEAAAETATSKSTRGAFDTGNIPIPFVTPILQLLQRYTLEPFNKVPRVLSGFDRPTTATGLAEALTAPGAKGTETFRGLEQARQTARGAGLRAPIAAQVYREARPYPEAELPPTVVTAPRIGRASGGRLTRGKHVAKASALIRAADQAKKQHNGSTKTILDQPDEVVAKALSLANSAI
jgi:hypothetical protein